MSFLFFLVFLLAPVHETMAQACGVNCDLGCDRYCKTVLETKICETASFNQCVQGEQACARSRYSVKASCQANRNYWKAYEAVEKAGKQGLITNRTQCSDKANVESIFIQMKVESAVDLAAYAVSDCGCYICETIFP